MEVKCFFMCFVFLSLSLNYEGHEIKNSEELEIDFKENQASTNASNTLLNIKLSPEKLKIEQGKQINQIKNKAKERKLNRADTTSNKQPDLMSHATKQVIIPINTLSGILSTNRKSKKLPKTVKNIPNQPKTGINENLAAIPPKIELTLNHSQVDTKNSTHNPEIDTKKEGTKKKFKLKTILIEDDNDIEHNKNIVEQHRILSSKSESNVLDIISGNTEKNKMPKDNKLANKTAEENLKSNNSEVVTVKSLKNKPTSVVNDSKIPNNHTKTANDTISFSNEKDNLSPKSANKDKDLELSKNRKSMSTKVKNYESSNEYDDSGFNKSNTKNLADIGNEKEETISTEAAFKHDVKKNDLLPISISKKDANKTSKFKNIEQMGTIFKPKLKGNLDDEEFEQPDDIIRIDQPFRIDLNEDNIKNETSISISMLPNRSVTIEKTNLEEIHETYHSNLYQNQTPEQENTQNSWYKSNQNYGQECQYPYQYGSYQTIPYSNNGYNSQYNYNYPLYQYGQPCNGYENYDQNIEDNGVVDNSWKEPLCFDNLAHYSEPNINGIFGNPFIENKIEETFEKDPAMNIKSPYVQPTNCVSDPISALSARSRYMQPIKNTILRNPFIENVNTGMKDPATVELPDISLFRNRQKYTFKDSTCPNVQSQYMRLYGNLENDKNVYGDIPLTENYFQKPINFNMEPRFNKPNNQDYNQIQFEKPKNLDNLPSSKTQTQELNIGKDPFREIQKIDSDPVYSKIETPTYHSFEQTPGYKDKIWRKWKNTRILINNLNKPITIEMKGLNRFKTPSCYKRPISDGTVDQKLKTNEVDRKQPMIQCTY